MPETGTAKTRITVQTGTAFDFFMSLGVLHAPKKFALRGAWASGMLARLTAQSRETLSRVHEIFGSPIHLVPMLPEPRSVETLLGHLSQREPLQLLKEITCTWRLQECGCGPIFEEVAERGQWTPDDRERLRSALEKPGDQGKSPSDEKLDRFLDVWAGARDFSESYLAALRNYQSVFFHEEEKRIAAANAVAAERVADRAKRVPLSDLIEEVSEGLRYEDLPEAREYVLAPSYWIAPLLLNTRLDADRVLFVFGSRIPGDSLVPGEAVPDGLVRGLKALSDPTRLRILRLVNGKPMGAAELARALRLRAPTVLHHLQALRLSALVQVRLPHTHSKQKAVFALRPQGVHDIASALEAFLGGTEGDAGAEEEPNASEGTQ